MKPKQSAPPGCKGRSPLQADGVQESKLNFLHSHPVGLWLQIGISMGSPGAPYISIPTWWFGLSLSDVDKERKKVATGPSLRQLPISFGPQLCPGVMERDRAGGEGEEYATQIPLSLPLFHVTTGVLLQQY